LSRIGRYEQGFKHYVTNMWQGDRNKTLEERVSCNEFLKHAIYTKATLTQLLFSRLIMFKYAKYIDLT